MQFKTFSASLGLLSLAAAQTAVTTPTTAAPAATGTSVADLVSQLPQCALNCFQQAASDIGCSATDFTCLCANTQDLVSKVGPCVLLGGSCSSDEISKATEIAPQICTAVNNNPSPGDLASASNLVTSALGTATGTPTASGNVAMRTDVAMGAMGVAAAFAVFAL